MKKQILIVLLGLFMAGNTLLANIGPVDGPNDRVAKSFQKLYKAVTDLKWFESESEYLAVFKQEDLQVKARFDKEGKLLGSTRFIKEEALPVAIANKLHKKHPTKKVYGITEVTDGSDVDYYIKMQCEKCWYTIHVSPSGSMSMTEKYDKAK